MAITFNTRYKYVSKQNLLFSGRLFHYRVVLIALFCSLASSIYAQTDCAEFEWMRKYFGYDTSTKMAKVFAIDDYGNAYIAVVNFNCP